VSQASGNADELSSIAGKQAVRSLAPALLATWLFARGVGDLVASF
jgi:hypothetical protein